MKYLFITEEGEEIDLFVSSVEDDVIILIEANEIQTPVSPSEFIERILTELAESDASPWEAVVAVVETLDSKLGKWYIESTFSDEDVERFRTYCAEQCGVDMSKEETISTLWL